MAEDTLYTIHVIVSTSDFTARLNSGAAKEQVPGDPTTWVWNNRYNLAAAPGWAAAVDSWLVSHPEGGDAWATDQSVITDNQIIGQIQALRALEG